MSPQDILPLFSNPSLKPTQIESALLPLAWKTSCSFELLRQVSAFDTCTYAASYCLSYLEGLFAPLRAI